MALTEQTLKVSSLNWFYREALPMNAPRGNPILLLHGLPAHSYIWRGVMPAIADAGFRAIAPDWIGSGFSDKPDKRSFNYTPAAFLQSLADFIQKAGIKSCSLVVQGFLASAGILYAQQNPEAIDRLIVLNTPLFARSKLPWLMQQWGLPFIGDMLTQDPLLVDRALEKGSGFVIADGDLAKFRQPYLKSSAVGRALIATIQKLNLAEMGQEIERGWQNWDRPTLLLWGTGDSWLPADPVQDLSRQHSAIEFSAIAGAKHYPQEHWPKETREAIVQFLRRQGC